MKAHRSSPFGIALLLTCLLPIGTSLTACASGESDEEAVEADADLSGSSILTLGSITSGETKTARYTKTPSYRAYSFTARAGDKVDAWVRSNNGDAKAYILRANFSSVTSNDDADASTNDSHLVATIQTAGTYYVAFKEYKGKAADFSVSFTKTAASAPGTFVLAKDAAGTTPFHVDDVLAVSVNGTEVSRQQVAGNPPLGPVRFNAQVGDKLRVDLIDLGGVCLDSDEIWLSGPGIRPARVTPSIALVCGTLASSSPYRSVEFTIGSYPTEPAPAFAFDATKTMAKVRDLNRYFAAGARTSNAATLEIAGRTRGACNTVTGCPAWTPATQLAITDHSFLDPRPSERSHALPLPTVGSAELMIPPTDNIHLALHLPDFLNLQCEPFTTPQRVNDDARFTCWRVAWNGNTYLYPTDGQRGPSDAYRFEGRLYTDGSYEVLSYIDPNARSSEITNLRQLYFRGKVTP